MDGHIGYDSAQGLGSTFWFTIDLPIAGDDEAAVRDEPEETPTGKLEKRLRVLVAEDNATNQLIITQMLERLGCTFDLASDGQEALEYALRNNYDCILMDVAMPNMDGIAATEAIRAARPEMPDLPIIAVTAYALPEDRRRLIGSGMNEVLTKPVERNALADLLSKIANNSDGSVQTKTGNQSRPAAVEGRPAVAPAGERRGFRPVGSRNALRRSARRSPAQDRRTVHHRYRGAERRAGRCN